MNTILGIVGLSLIAVLTNCDKSNVTNRSRATSENISNNQKRGGGKVAVHVLRDAGASTLIEIKHGDGSSESLYFVSSDNDLHDGKIYIRSDWENPEAKPLRKDEALAAMDRVEGILESHFGKEELQKIRDDGEMLSRLAGDELGEYLSDKKLNERLDAHYALELLMDTRSKLAIK